MESAMKDLNVIDIGDIHKLFEVLDNLDYRIKKIEEALKKENIQINNEKRSRISRHLPTMQNNNEESYR